MLFGKKKEQKSNQVTNRSKNAPVTQNSSEPKQKSTRQEILELKKILNESRRPIEHKSGINVIMATQDSEFRAIIREVRKAYGLWYLYVREHQDDISYYFGCESEKITEIDSLIQNAVYNLLYYSVGVCYKDGEITDDEGFTYIPIKKMLCHLDEDGKNRIVPALKKLGVVYDEFLTEFDYDIAKSFFNHVYKCRFTGSYYILKCNLHSNWHEEKEYDAASIAYWVKVILSNLHKPDRSYIFSVGGINVGITCTGTEAQLEFDVGYSTSWADIDDLPVKNPHFYSDPVHVTLDTENHVYVSLAQKIIDDRYEELDNIEFVVSKYADEYR